MVAGFAKKGFPVTPGAYSEEIKGLGDFFISSLNQDGSALTYSTFLGGYDGEDAGRVVKLAIDPDDHPIILSAAGDSGYPTTTGTHSPTNNGWRDIVLTKFNTDGSGLIFSTYFGGHGFEDAFTLDVDDSGSVYVAGQTDSHDFPTTPGAYEDSFGPNQSFFVAKFNSDATDLLYSTFISACSPSDRISELVVDSTGHCFLTGFTLESTFPVTSGALNVNFDTYASFLTKLNPTGSDLDFSTFLPSGFVFPSSLAVDSSGTSHILAATSQTGLPVTKGALDGTLSGSSDLYLMKINATGSELLYASYLGGSSDETALSLALDPQGALYFSAQTTSTDFPTTPGAFQESYHGGKDLTLSKLNPDGTALVYSTFLGGSSEDSHSGFAIDSSGAAYILGSTSSVDFPILTGSMTQITPEPYELFITRLNQAGSGLTYSTFLGAREVIFDNHRTGGLVLDSTNKVYAAGTTSQADFPTSEGAFQDRLQGEWDLYLLKMDLCVPYAPDAITGTSTVCRDEVGVVYSVPGLIDASGYTWTVPEGASISAGQGTSSITVDFGASSGEISVTADYSCGPSTPQTLTITVNAPPDPPAISGDALVCRQETGVTYSIAAVSGASDYLWTVPEGASIHSGQGTTSITVDFGQNGGEIAVQVQNTCGFSAPASVGVSLADPIQTPYIINPIVTCLDDTLEVTVGTTGTDPTFQWFRDEQPLVDDERTSGAQAATLRITSVGQADEGAYSCQVSNRCGSRTRPQLPLDPRRLTGRLRLPPRRRSGSRSRDL